MSQAQKASYKKSNEDFESIFRPWIMGKYPTLLDVQIVTNVELDRDHGIDFVASIPEGQFYAASKLQPSNKDWETICIRYTRGSGHKTEYQKIQDLIASDGIRPLIHMHSYYSFSGQMLASHWTFTGPLFDWLGSNLNSVRIQRKDNDTFLAVGIDQLRAAGIPVKTFK